jgi:hypothetical protein
MTYVNVEVEIQQGRVVVREPEKLPEKGIGLLTILALASMGAGWQKPLRQRVVLPLIREEGKRVINPTPRNWMPASGVIDLADANLWLG